LQIQINALGTLIETIAQKEQQYQSLDFQIDGYRIRFDKMMKEAGCCPLCGALPTKKGDHTCSQS
jgi:hypothetical protein